MQIRFQPGDVRTDTDATLVTVDLGILVIDFVPPFRPLEPYGHVHGLAGRFHFRKRAVSAWCIPPEKGTVAVIAFLRTGKHVQRPAVEPQYPMRSEIDDA